MLERTFHWEIRDVLAMFEDAFSNIVIKRFNENREAEGAIEVAFRMSPKTRTLSEIIEKNEHFKMPVVAISVGGIQRNRERVFSKIDGSHWAPPSLSAWRHLLQPVPIDITVNMSIVARFQQDVDQIITNFVPYCDPYVVVSWKWPDIIPWDDFEIRSHIRWNENITYQYPNDVANNTAYRVIADTSFTIESWMFKNSPDNSGPIYNIDTSFTAISDMNRFEVMKSYEDQYNTEQFWVSGRPQLTLCQPAFMFIGTTYPVTLYGKMLDKVDMLYVSAADWSIFKSSLSSVVEVSGLSGVAVPSWYWTSDSANQITLNPVATAAGFFDVIATNAAGIGVLSRDSIRETLNPYPSGSAAYNSYVEYQYPSISGVEVL